MTYDLRETYQGTVVNTIGPYVDLAEAFEAGKSRLLGCASQISTRIVNTQTGVWVLYLHKQVGTLRLLIEVRGGKP